MLGAVPRRATHHPGVVDGAREVPEHVALRAHLRGAPPRVDGVVHREPSWCSVTGTTTALPRVGRALPRPSGRSAPSRTTG
ncbi:hypothetical protein Cus16_2872 [Curtobacterium sp. ER1/6]|nr:hypothetical protein Cus16_2872 [Curtobacterium sp. ER1/6]